MTHGHGAPTRIGCAARCGLPDWKPRGRDPEATRRKRERENNKRRHPHHARPPAPIVMSKRRPWEALGMSRATWYRRGRPEAVRQLLPTHTKFTRGQPLNSETVNSEHANT